MSEKIRHPREITTSDGRTLKIGDKLPVPEKPKLKISPAHWIDDKGTRPRVFRSRG